MFCEIEAMKAAKPSSAMLPRAIATRGRRGFLPNHQPSPTTRRGPWRSWRARRRFRLWPGETGRKMTANHPRNTGPMLSSPRCGARTRSGKPCQSPAVQGNKRCRMHGGAAGSGAPRGNRNAQKHGLHTREAIAQRRQIGELMRQSRMLVMKIE